MNKHLQSQRDNFIKRIVSNARAILSNQIGLPLGVLKMEKIHGWINNIQPLTDIDLQIFSDYNSQTTNFSIGTDRLLCEKDFLKQQDKKLDELTFKYKDGIIDKCFEIVDKFGSRKI